VIFKNMDMKKIFLGFAILLLAEQLVAQVTMQLSVPATGMIQKNQLWNVLVVNPTNKQYDCRLELVLRDRITGQEVMTATTGQFTIASGSKQLNATVLSPIQYNNILSGIDTRLQGLLPTGSYTACYASSSITLKETNLAEECISFDAEPLSPPMLIFPADSAELDNAPTQLSWTPPTPEGMFDRLHYEIAITEIKDGQKAPEAIQENLPFYADGALYTNNMNYPGTATSFEKDKWYAWQVVARDDRNYAGKSEVWVFKVKSPSIGQLIVEQAPFTKMRKDNPDKGIAPNGILKLSYINETADSFAQVNIIEPGNQNKIIASFTVALKPGENLLENNVKKKFHLQEGVIYQAELINSRKEKWVMQFEVREYNNKKISE
jgi:hypothetical protein